MQKSAGPIVLAFAGVVLLVMAVRGSLKNVWGALLKPDAGSAGSTSSAATNPSGSSIFSGAIGAVGAALTPPVGYPDPNAPTIGSETTAPPVGAPGSGVTGP